MSLMDERNEGAAGSIEDWIWPRNGGEPRVHCPVCGSEQAHFQGIEYQASRGVPITVRFLHGEDDPDVKVSVEQLATISGRPWLPHPSSRRGAFTVNFEGECGHLFALNFEQHKGQESMHLVALVDYAS